MQFTRRNSIIEVVKENLIENILCVTDANDVIAVGVSGGVDSMVLLRAVEEAAKIKGFKYFVVNVEHGIRGDNSVKDSEFVKNYADGKNIRCMVYRVDALKRAADFGETLEEGARAVRYGVFDSLLANGDCNKVFLAHHRADQAETVLMRILRGTGIKGLAGMKKINGGYVRPFLDVSKEEIVGFADRHGVGYVVDETNLSNDCTRNFLRNRIFPELKEASFDAQTALVRLARIAGETEDFLKTCDFPVVHDGDKIIVKTSEAANRFLFKRAVMRAFNEVGAEKDVEERHINLIAELANGKNGASLDMPFGITVSKEYDKLVFSKKQSKRAFETPFSTGKISFLNNTIIIVPENESSSAGKSLRFDIAGIPADAVIRTRRAGDSFTKFGGGTKSLGDYMTDKKIPKRIRDEIPVVASGNDVLIIAGVEISDKVRTDENTKKENFYTIITEDML